MNNKLKKALFISMLLLILDSKKVNAELFIDEETQEKYLNDQIKYFKEHPEEMEKYAESGEEIILKKGKDVYVDQVSTQIADIKQEIGDICYYKANTRFGYSPNVKRRTPEVKENELIGWKKGVILNIEEGTNMPIAICDYDEETNTVGSFLGYARDEDVNTQMIGYAEVIENDVVASLTFGDFFDWETCYFDEDGNYHEEDPLYYLPYWYTPIDDNEEHGIDIHYSYKEIDGYVNMGDRYESKDVYKVRSQIDPKNIPLELVKKYGPKNTNN